VNKAAQDDGRAGRSQGANTSSREQGPNFDLVGTSQMVIVRETCGVTRTMCWSGSSPAWCISIQITMTLSDMSERLFVAIISLYILMFLDG
jgi:hypothetical protein